MWVACVIPYPFIYLNDLTSLAQMSRRCLVMRTSRVWLRRRRAIVGPAIHARVDGVPTAESLGQPAPLATVLGHVQDRIEDEQIRVVDVATLFRQTVLDLFILRLDCATTGNWRTMHLECAFMNSSALK